MSSINNKLDFSGIFGIIEDGLNIDTKEIKKVTEFFGLTEDNPKNPTAGYGKPSMQGKTTYMKQKMANSQADIQARKQRIIEQKEKRARERGQEPTVEKTVLKEKRNEKRNEKRSNIKTEVSKARLREAIVWSEILGPPVSKRRHSRVSRNKYKF